MKAGMVAAPAVLSGEVLGYTDEPVERYRKDIDGAESLDKLIDALARWPVLARDAYEQATAPGFDWDDWTSGRIRERGGHFAGEAFARRYGAILMPGEMVRVGLVAARFNVPFGVAYLRLWDQAAAKGKP